MPWYALVKNGEVVREQFFAAELPKNRRNADLKPLAINEEKRGPFDTVGEPVYQVRAGDVVKIIPKGTPNFERARKSKIREVEAAAERAQEAGFMFRDIRFQLRERDIPRIMGMATKAVFSILQRLNNSGPIIPWDGSEKFIARDNSIVMLSTPQDAIAFAFAAYSRLAEITFRSRTKKDEIAALPDDIQVILDYDASEGWTP